MLSINFSTLKAEAPDLSRSWEALEKWSRAHADATVISPAAVTQYLKHEAPLSWDDVSNLASALELLAEKGILIRRFAVQSTTGNLVSPYYGRRDQIPRRVRGDIEEWINTSDAEIKPVFVGAGADD